ncbi:uncharacterized protein [Chironomus tepperi]|uniref:uncharacterized protein n=1 Tax=Chironomus tepperi TaxID=113505 RepID=UPI00391F2C1D
MKIFILSPLILLTIQVLLSCNCQLVSITGSPDFSLSSSTLQILKSADSSNSKAFKSMLNFGGFGNVPPITAVQVASAASDLTKNVITNNIQNDLTNIMNAVNSIATSLSGCRPQISYPNDFNISTACFTATCTSTEHQCQALYLQIAIDQLTIALNTATYNLNLTSSILVGSGWNFPSLSALLTQWSIVEASAAAYQNSTKTGPLISAVNSSFKKVLSASLNGTTFFLDQFEAGYMTLVSSLNTTNYVQTLDDNTNLNILGATSTALRSLLTNPFQFDGIVLKSSSVQWTVSGISISSFVRPAAVKVFDSLAALSSTFNTELSNFQANIQSLNAEQQAILTNLKLNSTIQLKSTMYEFTSKSTPSDIDACCASISITSTNPYPDALSSINLNPIIQSTQNRTLTLISSYKSLISLYTDMSINCFKVGCTGNTIYPYSLWKLQCANDFSFTNFCWSSGFPRTLQRCSSVKAQSLNACLNHTMSLITSLQPATDMNKILDDTRSSFDALLNGFSDTANAIVTSLREKSLCMYTRIYSSA